MTTFFVRQSGGNDGNDGLTFATAWANPQMAADTAVAGDVILVSSDGIYVLATPVDLDTNAGAPRNPIRWRGAGPLGQDDGSVVTLDGSGVSPAALGACMRTGSTNFVSSNVWFEGFRFTGGANRNWSCDADQRGILFVRCRFDNAVVDGFLYNDANAYCLFVDCEFDNNGGDGIGPQAGTDGFRLFATNCSFHDNAVDGISRVISISLQGCWVYKNGGRGVKSANVNPDVQVANCVIDGNTDNGMEMTAVTVGGDHGLLLVQNNIISNNGGFGISFEGDPVDGIIGNNLYFNNTSGDVSIDGISADTFADFDTMGTSIVGDPQFLNTGAGTEDYRIPSSSPAFEAGFPPTFQRLGAPNFAHIGSSVPEAVDGGRIIGG